MFFSFFFGLFCIFFFFFEEEETWAFGVVRSTVNDGVDGFRFRRSPATHLEITASRKTTYRRVRVFCSRQPIKHVSRCVFQTDAAGCPRKSSIIILYHYWRAKYYERAFQTYVSVWTHVRNAIESAENTPRCTPSPEPRATGGKKRFKLLLLTSIKGCHAKEKRSGPGCRRRFQKHTCPV